MKLSPTLKTLALLQAAASSSLASSCSSVTKNADSGSVSTSETTIVRDVVMIGGGGSGTFAAIRLQQEGYSVALVEKRERLGGHVDTYRDAATGIAIDYGVGVYANISAVVDYFSYLDVPLVSVPAVAPNTLVFANFETDGKAVAPPASFAWTNQTAIGLGLFGYLQQQGQYPFIGNGFDLPDPVPEDLLLRWGDFLEKYSLQAIANVASQYLQGLGDILAQPTLYVMKYLTQRTVNTILGTGPTFVTSGSGSGNQALYEAALARLGADAFLNSNVVSIVRSETGVEVVFDAPAGRQTVQARKLVVAIQPTLANLQALHLDLTADESALFAQFNHSYYWDAVLSASGLPPATGLQNIDVDAPYGIPAQPATYTFTPTQVDGLLTAWYGSPSYVSDEDVRAALLAELVRTAGANGYNLTSAPSVVALNNHAPFELTVPVEAIRAGFYGDVNALQGERSTWWTGAAWQAPDSSEIWNWMEGTLLPRVLASLE